MTLHSVTQETLPILHSDKDQLSAIRADDYYTSYRLITVFLAYLDSKVPAGSNAVAHPQPNTETDTAKP
jgi:hypothetical protein